MWDQIWGYISYVSLLILNYEFLLIHEPQKLGLRKLTSFYIYYKLNFYMS